MISSRHSIIADSDAKLADSTPTFETFRELNISQINRSNESSNSNCPLEERCGTFTFREVRHLKTDFKLLYYFPKSSEASIMVTKFSVHKMVSMAQPIENLNRRIRPNKSLHVLTTKVGGTRRYRQILCYSKIGGVANL